jgi:tetratricopeptide (TPR) repeat protein
MHSMLSLIGHSHEPEADTATAMELANRAVDLDNEFALSHSALGLAYSASGRHGDAVAAARRAVELQPGDADSHAYYARTLIWAGLAEQAVEAIQTALRLDPQFYEGPHLNLLGRIHVAAGRYEDAIDAFKRNEARGGPRSEIMLVPWVAACAHLGWIDETQKLAKELLRADPNLTLSQIRDGRWMSLGETEKKHLVDGLHKAGLSE